MEKALGFFGQLPDREEQEITLPSGRKITIMETTGADESALSKSVRKNAAQGVNKFLSRITKNLDGKVGAVDASEFRTMLSGDRTAILLYSRILTHGAEFNFNLQCTSCDQKGDFLIDLNKIVETIKPYPNGDARDFSLDCDGHQLFFSLPDGVLEEKIADDKELDINKRIGAMKMWEQTEKGALPVKVDALKSKYIAALRKKVKECESDIDSVVTLKCENCGTAHETDLAGDISFLFPNVT